MERDQILYERRERGEALTTLADEYGISAARVGQLIARHKRWLATAAAHKRMREVTPPSDLPVEAAGFTPRVRNALKFSGHDTLADVAETLKRGRAELLKLPELGTTALEAIETCLTAHGLWKPDNPRREIDRLRERLAEIEAAAQRLRHRIETLEAA